MAVGNIEKWKKATTEEKKKYVKWGLDKIANFEQATKEIIEIFSKRPLNEGREMIEVQKECLEYIQELKKEL